MIEIQTIHLIAISSLILQPVGKTCGLRRKWNYDSYLQGNQGL